MAFKDNTRLRDKTEVKLPKMYKVLFYNDDFTTMEFVVEVLEQVFNKGQQEAYTIMMAIHKSDFAVVGVYTKDIAYTKAAKATDMAREAGYPLKVVAVSQ